MKLPAIDNARLAFLSKDQAATILEELQLYDNEILYDISIMLLYTGARFGEVTALTWNDINYDTNMIYYKPTKNGNARWVYMNKLVKSVCIKVMQSRKN